MRSSKVRVTIYRDPDTLAHAAADLFRAAAASATARADRFTVALSGGTTPGRFYSLLGSAAYAGEIDWSKVQVFWTDERCVPPDHHESNYKLASFSFLSKVPLPFKNIHRIRGEEGPERAAHMYAIDIRAFFQQDPFPEFDLIVLGVGRDGHTASLFPGDAAVDERVRPAAAVRRQPPDHDRVTLTLPVLAQAREVVVLASGRSKASVVREIVEDGNPKAYPAGLVRPAYGTLHWLLDEEAAGGLSVGTRPKPE